MLQTQVQQVHSNKETCWVYAEPVFEDNRRRHSAIMAKSCDCGQCYCSDTMITLSVSFAKAATTMAIARPFGDDD